MGLDEFLNLIFNVGYADIALLCILNLHLLLDILYIFPSIKCMSMIIDAKTCALHYGPPCNSGVPVQLHDK